MSARRRFRGSSQSLLLLLLVVVGPPAMTVVWLGWRFLEQDRVFLAQQADERRRLAGQAVVHSLEQALADAERTVVAGPIPDGTVRLTITDQGVDAQPKDRVLWLASASLPPAAESPPFLDAERQEFQGASEPALAAYRLLARSPRPAVRAGALLRVARIQRRGGYRDDALETYRELAAIHGVAIESTPADLLARRAIGAVLDESGRVSDLARESAVLEADIVAGRWSLDRPAWELASLEIERWRGHPLPVAANRRLFSAVADLLWDDHRSGAGRSLVSKRRVINADGTPVTVLAQTQGASTHVLAISPMVLKTWIDRLGGTTLDREHRVALVSPSGVTMAGAPPVAGGVPIRWAASETGLPWTITLGPGDGSMLEGSLAARRRQLSLGLAAMLLLLAGGSYFLWRVLQRELAVARLQTEFVAAVSHEFRTPLTSLRHVTELLDESDDLGPERRRVFYATLGRNTERLQGLVESLLDFARMEGRRKPYDLRPLDAAQLVRDVVQQFQKDAEARGFAIDTAIAQDRAYPVRADPAALTTAIWNLLDNAMKYSPGGRLVKVSMDRRGSDVAISVHDSGLGIPRRDQKDVFDRFVRGANAVQHAIKGTGLGLAMALHVAEAHGGTIDLQSEEGAGSTFTIVLPVRNDAATQGALAHRVEAEP